MTIAVRTRPREKYAPALREWLHLSLNGAGPDYGALDARDEAILVVDADRQLAFANAAGERLLAVADTLCVLAARHTGKPTLSAVKQADTAILDRLVRAVADAKAGGVLRLLPLHLDGSPGLAMTITPLPLRLFDGDRAPEATPGLAMILAVDLRRGRAPPTDALRKWFALSRAESEVAAALARGATAERISLARNVSLDTVRTQIRVILHKVGATGLRDLERILAKLPRPF